MYSYLFTRIFY